MSCFSPDSLRKYPVDHDYGHMTMSLKHALMVHYWTAARQWGLPGLRDRLGSCLEALKAEEGATRALQTGLEVTELNLQNLPNMIEQSKEELEKAKEELKLALKDVTPTIFDGSIQADADPDHIDADLVELQEQQARELAAVAVLQKRAKVTECKIRHTRASCQLVCAKIGLQIKTRELAQSASAIEISGFMVQTLTHILIAAGRVGYGCKFAYIFTIDAILMCADVPSIDLGHEVMVQIDEPGGQNSKVLKRKREISDVGCGSERTM